MLPRRDANRVRTDGAHTVAEVSAQMAYLREVRGPGQHAQLIGGEVTLLGPEQHAAALDAMRAQDRKPMSMTHGDFDYDYLQRLAVGPDGHRRFGQLRFAGHFDSLMLGRRGIPRPRSEAQLHALPAAVRGEVRAAARGARGAFRSRAQHDGHATKPR